jgi:hypothetical protein
MIAKRCGPEFLYDPQRMHQVLGPHSAASFDSEEFNKARRIVEGLGDGGAVKPAA